MTIKQYRRSIFLILTFILAALAACTPTAVPEAEIESQTEEDALRRVTEVADSVSEESEEAAGDIESPEAEMSDENEIVDEEAAAIDESLKKLPGLANSGTGGANASLPPATLGGAGGESITGQAEGSLDVADPLGSSLVIDSNLFEETEFVLTAELPQTPAGQIAIVRTRSDMNLELARELAANFQFPAVIYQQQLPVEMLENIRMETDGTFPDMPFLAFDNGSQLVMTAGSLWISYPQQQVSENVIIDINDFSKDQILAQTQALLDSYDFIDFEYTLRAEAYGSVVVIPTYSDVSPNQPIMGFYYTLDEAKNPVLQSMYMDLYSEVEIVGDYPILSAENAWQALKPGLIDYTTSWYFVDAPLQTELLQLPDDAIQPQFWLPEAQSDEAVNLYGYPTVYNPIGQDALPYILLEDTLVQGPADIGMMLATSDAGLFKFTGQYAESDGNSKTFFAQSVTPLGFEDQLFTQGTAVRDGDQLFVDSADLGRIQLNAAPADLPDGIELFVNGYRNGETAEGIPLIDWQYLDEVVDFGEFSVVDPLPVDGGVFVENNFDTISITAIELGYGISWPQSEVDELSGEYQPINSDYLIPIWKFSGTTPDGMELRFEIPAIDQGYFASN
ncbi:MAG: hypothetical protein AB8G95_27945 [Anaerolineae bacterium]